MHVRLTQIKGTNTAAIASCEGYCAQVPERGRSLTLVMRYPPNQEPAEFKLNTLTRVVGPMGSRYRITTDTGAVFDYEILGHDGAEGQIVQLLPGMIHAVRRWVDAVHETGARVPVIPETLVDLQIVTAVYFANQGLVDTFAEFGFKEDALYLICVRNAEDVLWVPKDAPDTDAITEVLE